jgi:hypothetical protein
MSVNMGAAVMRDQRNTDGGDFADWLSPMIVKELRQGLRTRTFTGLFILIQIAMVIITWMSLSNSSVQSPVRGIFWFILTLAVGGLIPFKGFQAISGETGENTLDLLVLTRLQALRIVAGKWAALVAQSFLAIVAILPYVFIHYFLGGVDVLHELFYIALLFFASAVLSAVTVCLSASGGKKARKGFGIFGFLILGFLIFQGFGIFMRMSLGISGSSPFAFGSDIKPLLKALPVVVVYGTYLIYFFLEIGAGRLAPSACNHTTRRRLISLGMAGILAVMTALKITPVEAWAQLAMYTVALAVIDALTDLPAVMRSLLVPFHARRAASAAYFLAPGWHTGALFSFILLMIFALAVLGIAATPGDQIAFFLTASSIVIMPAALVATFLRQRRKPFRDYLIVHLICVCIVAVLGLLSSVSRVEGYIIIGSIFAPHAGAFLGEYIDDSTEVFWVSVVGGWHLALAYLLLFWRGRPLFAQMRALNAEIRAERREASVEKNRNPAEMDK